MAGQREILSLSGVGRRSWRTGFCISGDGEVVEQDEILYLGGWGDDDRGTDTVSRGVGRRWGRIRCGISGVGEVVGQVGFPYLRGGETVGRDKNEWRREVPGWAGGHLGVIW